MFVDIQVVEPQTPRELPVTIEEGRAQGRIPDTVTDNALLQSKLEAATEKCEKFTRRTLVTQTLDVWFDSWDSPGVIENLPRGKVQSIVEIATYPDLSNTPVIVPPSLYTLYGNALVFSDWLWFRQRMGIRVRLVSGYGDPDDVPELLKVGILEYAVHLYENRLGEAPEVKYQAMVSTGGLPAGVYDKWRSFRIEMV